MLEKSHRLDKISGTLTLQFKIVICSLSDTTFWVLEPICRWLLPIYNICQTVLVMWTLHAAIPSRELEVLC